MLPFRPLAVWVEFGELLVVGEGRTLANVYVKVKNGLPDGSWPVPSEPVVLDQQGCRYIPHVTGIMVDQTGTYASAFYLTAAILVLGWLTFLVFGTGKQILD